MDKGSIVLSANEGVVYVNNEIWSDVTKASGKSTAEYDDVNFVGDPKTYKRYKGMKVEGSLTIKKSNSKVAKLIAEGIRTGNMPEIKLVIKQGTPTGKAERVALYGVNFSELSLFELEANSLIDQEIPFTASDFEYLDFID